MERLKNSRSRLLEKYRQLGDPTKSSLLVQEVMEMEWSALQSANERLPSLWKKDGVSEVRVSQISPVHLDLLFLFIYFYFLCLILQMYREMQEYDELAVLEEIQQELVSQGYFSKRNSLFSIHMGSSRNLVFFILVSLHCISSVYAIISL